MHIIHIATEFAPYAKVGGLGDVVQGLAAEQANLGHSVEVILPKYSWINKDLLPDLELTTPSFFSWEDSNKANALYSTSIGKTKLHFIEPVDNKYFDRTRIYGYPDDIQRLAYFSRASLDYLLLKKTPVDILHIHDWHSSLVAPLYKEIFAQKGLLVKGILLTLHNLSYQGICDPKLLLPIGFRKNSPYLKKMKQSFFSSSVNILKGGIDFSDKVIAVSPTYAKEIFSKQDSCGLQKTLEKNHSKISGILNGIETEYWNPLLDPHLSQNYSSKDPLTQIISAKSHNKNTLQQKLALSQNPRPLVSCITRLVPQKGPELIKSALARTLELGGQFVLLGSSQDPATELEFRLLAKEYADNPHVACILEYDEPLSHLIYAASDFIVIPSRFEPCGLTQMISLNYGTLPIARKVGGLADTVHDCDDENIPQNKRNGYTFQTYSDEALFSALDRALNDWCTDKEKIHKLMKIGMKENFSWKHSAEVYISQYKELL